MSTLVSQRLTHLEEKGRCVRAETLEDVHRVEAETAVGH
jgi:DNA-binding HxlR family transcriptional regulator